MRGLFVVPLLLLSAGCWQPRLFIPRENLNGTGPDGDPSAVYAVRDGVSEQVVAGAGAEGASPVELGTAELSTADLLPAGLGQQQSQIRQKRGEIRLWSSGAKARYAEHDQEVVDLHVGFELENTSDAPLELDVDSVQVEELFLDGYLQGYIQPHSVTGSGQVAPGTTARVDMVFRPDTTYPSEIDSFSVRFAVRDGKGHRVGQVTPFVPGSRWQRGATVRSPLGYGGFGWGGFYGWGGPWGGAGMWGGPFGRGGFCR